MIFALFLLTFCVCIISEMSVFILYAETQALYFGLCVFIMTMFHLAFSCTASGISFTILGVDYETPLPEHSIFTKDYIPVCVGVVAIFVSIGITKVMIMYRIQLLALIRNARENHYCVYFASFALHLLCHSLSKGDVFVVFTLSCIFYMFLAIVVLFGRKEDAVAIAYEITFLFHIYAIFLYFEKGVIYQAVVSGLIALTAFVALWIPRGHFIDDYVNFQRHQE